MFRYDEVSKTYSVAFATPEETSAADYQDIVLKSTFKMFKQADFHDEWFCEFPYCDTTFWTGGRHHCRMCGMSICDIHGQQDVNLSTHLLPVVKDVPANITSPVLAFSRGSLPEVLEFKRACLLCCDRAKPTDYVGTGTRTKSRQLKHADIAHVQAELTTTQAMLAQLDHKVSQKEKSKLPSNNTFHWGADDELSNKIRAMKEKKVNKAHREKLQMYMDRQAIIQNIAYEKAEKACRMVENFAAEAQSTLQAARDAAQECESSTILARKEAKIQEEYRSAAEQSFAEVETAQIKVSLHAREAEKKTAAANYAISRVLDLHHAALAGALRDSRDVNAALALAEAEWRQNSVSAHFMDSQRASFANEQSVIAAKLSVLHAEHVIQCTSIAANARTLNENSHTTVQARAVKESAAVVIDLEQRPSKIADIVSASTQAAEMTIALHAHIIACLANAREVQGEAVLAANECIEVGTEIENLLRTNKKLEAQAPHTPNSSPTDARLLLTRAAAACDQIEAVLLLAKEVMQAAKMDAECVNVYCAQAQVTRSEAERLAQEMHACAQKAATDATHTKQIESACRKRARELLSTANTVSENAYDDAASAQSTSALAKFAEKTSILSKLRQDAEQAVLTAIGAAGGAAECLQVARASSVSVAGAATDAQRQAAILQSSLDQMLSPCEAAKASHETTAQDARAVDGKCAVVMGRVQEADLTAETALDEQLQQRQTLVAEAAAAEEAWTANNVDEVFRLSQRAAFAEQHVKLSAQMHDIATQRAITAAEHLAAVRNVTDVESARAHASETSAATTLVTAIQMAAPTTQPVREACQRAEVSAQASADAHEKAERAVETAKAAHLATRHSLETAIITIRALHVCAAECKRVNGVTPEWDDSVVSVLESLQLRAAAALIATEQSTLQVTDVHQKTLIVAQEAGAATAVAVTAHAQIDVSAAEAVRASTAAEDQAAKAALALAESIEAATQANAQAVSSTTDATENHKQALVAFASLQAALIVKAREVAERDVVLAEATAAKIEALATAMEKAALHIEGDVESTREDEEKMVALLTHLDELHYRAHCAHTAAEEAALFAANNADTTDHAIAVANAGYNASREVHENKLKLLIQKYAVVTKLSGERAPASEKAKLLIRSVHRQLDLLKSLGVLSNQRLLGALNLAESVKVQSKADTVAEQAHRAKVDRVHAAAALEGHADRLERVSAAQKRAHRCRKVISVASIAKSESEQNSVSVQQAAAQAKSLVELHARTASLLTWADSECEKYGFQAPHRDIVEAEEVLLLQQRGTEAVENLSTSAERLHVSREQGVMYVTSIKDNCDLVLLKSNTVEELINKVSEAAVGASDAAIKTKHLEVSTAAAASAVLRSTKIQARKYRDTVVATEQQLRAAQECFVTRPSRSAFGAYLATALSADMRIYAPKDNAGVPLDSEEISAKVKTVPYHEGHVVIKPAVKFGDALESQAEPDDGTLDLAATGFERSAQSIERERLAAEALLAKQTAAQVKAEELIAAAFAADAVGEELSARAEQVSLSLAATVQGAEEAAKTAMTSLEAVVTELRAADYSRVKTEELSAGADNSLRAAILEANVSEENATASAAAIAAANETAAAAREALQSSIDTLELTVAEAHAWWERDNVSAVDRATEYVAFAEQRAELLAQVSALTESRRTQAHDHITTISAHTEAAEAAEKVSAIGVMLEAARRLRADIPSPEAALLAVEESLQAAERTNAAAVDTLTAKAEILAITENACAAAEAASQAAAEARAAVEECLEIGADCPTFHTASTRKEINRRARQCEDATRLASEKAEMVLALQLDAQQSAETASRKCGQIMAARALCDLAVANIHETSIEVASEAARAQAAHHSSVTAAEAALLLCEDAVRDSTSAHQEAILSVQIAKDALVVAEEVEAARVAAELAETARLAAEALLATQQAAQARAEELVSAAKAADATAEELSLSAEQLAQYLTTTVQGAQEAAVTAKESMSTVSSALVEQSQYHTRAEELSMVAENALLAATLEANVSEENSDASKARMDSADEVTAATCAAIEASVSALEASVAAAEVLWEVEQTPETVQAAERVRFAERRAEIHDQYADAAKARRAQAADHVALVTAHTEAQDAAQQVASTLAVLEDLKSLQADTPSTEAARLAVKSAVGAVERANVAADCAAAAKEELRVVVEAATLAAEEACLAAANAQSALTECEELGAECASVGVLNDAEDVTRRETRLAEATKVIVKQSELVFELHVQVQTDALTAAQTCGLVVATRTLGDLVAQSVPETAADASAEASRALSAHETTIATARFVLERCEDTVRARMELREAAHLAIQTAKDAHKVAEEKEAARVAAELAETERIAAEALLARHQVMLTKAQELVNAAVTADAESEQLAAAAVVIASKTSSAVAVAQEASQTIASAAVTAADTRLGAEKIQERVEELRVTAESAQHAAASQAALSEEERVASEAETKVEDDTVAESRVTINATLAALEVTAAEAEGRWESEQVPATVRTAGRLQFVQRRTQLLNDLSVAADGRREPAAWHVIAVKAHTLASDAEESAAVARAALCSAEELLKEETSTDADSTAVVSIQESLTIVLGAVDAVSVAKEELRVAIEAATRAAANAAQTLSEARAAVAECEAEGLECPSVDSLGDADASSDRTQKLSEAVMLVDEQSTVVLTLLYEAHQSAELISQHHNQAVVAREAGTTSVTRIAELSTIADAEAARALRAHEATVAAAEAVLARCEDAVSTSTEAYEIAKASIQDEIDAHTAAVEAESAREAAELAKAEHLAAEALLLKQQDAQTKAQDLVTAAKAADEKADVLSAEAEQLSLSFVSIVSTAEEALQAAKISSVTIAEALSSANQFYERTEELSASVESARQAATLSAEVCERNREETTTTIKTADEATTEARAAVEASLAALDAAAVEAEERWESEIVAEIVRSENRANFAEQRADLLLQLSHLSENRRAQAVEFLAAMESRADAIEAHEQLAAAQEALETAQNLQVELLPSLEATSVALQACREATERATSAAEQASAAKEEVVAAVKAATVAAVEASKAASDAQSAVVECTVLGIEGSSVEQLNNVENVARRKVQRADAVKHANEQVETVKALSVETRQITELASQQHGQTTANHTAATQHVACISLAVAAACTAAAQAQGAHAATVAAAKDALVRCEAAETRDAEAVAAAQMLVLAANEAHAAAVAAASARLDAEITEAARLETEAVLAKQQMMQINAEELVSLATSAEAAAKDLFVQVERVAQSLEATVHAAQQAGAEVAASVSAVSKVLVVLESYHARAEEMSVTADNAVRSAALEANVAEENSEALRVRISSADEEHAVDRSSVETVISALDTTVSEAEAKWKTEKVTETARATQRILFAEHRSELLSQLADLGENRRTQAVEHVAVVSAQTEPADAEQHAALVRSLAETALALQAETPLVDTLAVEVQASQHVSATASAAAKSAMAKREELRIAVEAAAQAAEVAAQASFTARSAVAECAEVGIEGPAVAKSSGVDTQNEQLLEYIIRADEQVQVVLSLQAKAQLDADQVSHLRGHAVVARTLGDLAVRSVVEATTEAEAEASRATASHEATLAAAEARLNIAEQTAAESTEARDGALLSVQVLKEARVAAEEAEAARVAEELAEAERVAAEVLLVKREAIRLRAQGLVTAAIATDEEAERLSVEAEQASLSSADALTATEEALKVAKTNAAAITDALSAINQAHERAEELKVSAEAARQAVTTGAEACDMNRQTSATCVVTADDVTAEARATIEASLTALDVSVAAAEAQWELEQAAETVMTTHRVTFAEQRADLLLQLSHLSESRRVQAVEQVAVVEAHREAVDAAKQTTTAQTSLVSAQNREADLPSLEGASDALQACQDSAQSAVAALNHATAAKEEVTAIVKAATVAAVEASKAASEARSTAAECTELGIEGPSVEPLNNAENVARRTKQRADAVKRVNEQAEAVLTLCTETQQISELSSQRHSQALAAHAAATQTICQIEETAAATNTEVVRTQGVQSVSVEAAKEALARCEVAATWDAEAVDNAQLLVLAANEAHAAAAVAESARLTAVAAETARLEAEELLVRQQTMQATAQELVSAALAADAAAKELIVHVESIDLCLAVIVHAAEDAAAEVCSSVGAVSEGLSALESYRIRAEELSLGADNALRSVILEANVAEENREASGDRIHAADEALAVKRASIESSVAALQITASEAEVKWESQEVAEVERVAQRLLFAEQRAGLLSQLADFGESRRVQAVEHVAVVSDHTEPADAEQHFAVVRALSQSTHVRKADIDPSGETLSTAALVCHQAAQNASAAAESATSTREELRVAVERATLTAETASCAAEEARTAVKACEEMGIECPSADELTAIDSDPRSNEHLLETLKRVDEHVEIVLALQAEADQKAAQAVHLRGQAVVARTLGDLAVRSIDDAVTEAVTEVTRAQTTHDATLTAAEAALKHCQDAVVMSTEAKASAMLSVRALREAYSTAEDAEVAHVSTKLAEIERLTAEALLAKQQEVQAKAQLLVATAKAADEKAERLSAESEQLSLSFVDAVGAAEEALQAAKTGVATISAALDAANQSAERAVEFGVQSESTRQVATASAEACVKSHETTVTNIKTADSAALDVSTAVETSLAALDTSVVEAEARWESEQATEAVRSERRVGFAEQRAELLLQLSQVSVKRHAQAGDLVATVLTHTEAVKATEQAAASQAALESARAIQAELQSKVEAASIALQTCQDAAERAKAVSVRASAAKEEVSAAVKAATVAAVEASQAASDAQSAVSACIEVGTECPSLEDFNTSENVARRTKQRADAVKRVNEQAEAARTLCTETHKIAELATQQHEHTRDALTAVAQSVSHTAEAAEAAGAEAVRAQGAHTAAVAAAEEALARCELAPTECAEAANNAQMLLQAAHEAHTTALAAESVRLIEGATEAARLEAEALILKQQTIQARAEELVCVAVAADTAAKELFVNAEQVAQSLSATVHVAEEAAADAKASASVVSECLLTLEGDHTRAEELSRAAENAVRGAALEANVAEENSDASNMRITAADQAVVVTTVSIEASVVALDTSAAESEATWEAEEVAEGARIAQRLLFAEQRAGLLSQVVDLAENRRTQAVEHVAVIGAHTEPVVAEQQAVLTRAALETALALQADSAAADALSAAVLTSQQAAERASAAAESATVAKEELRLAVKAAVQAAVVASQAALEARSAVRECEELGIECPSVHSLPTTDSALQGDNMLETVKRADEQVAAVLALQAETALSATQASQLRGQAIVVRTLGDLAVRSIAEAVAEAEAEAVRAQSTHIAALATARAALQLCEEAAAASAEERASALLSVEVLKKEHTAAEEADAARVSADLAEAERMAAEAIVAKKQEVRSRAEELLSAAIVADAESEKLSLDVEVLSLSLGATVEAAEQAASTATACATTLSETMLALDQFRAQTEEMCTTAENAARDATVEANVSEENSEATAARIQAADDAAAAVRASIESSLALLEVAMAEAEVRWQAQHVTEVVRSAEHMKFSEQRSHLRSQLEEIAEKRRIQADDLMSVVHTYMEGAEAAEKAAAATSAFEFAQSLLASIPAPEIALLAVQESQRAVDKASAAATHATTVKEEVRAAVEAATRAAVIAARAMSDAKAAVAECEELGVEAPSIEKLDNPEDVSRRAKQRSESVRVTNQHVERVLSLQQETRASTDQVVQQQGRAVAARVLGTLALSNTDEAVIEAVCQAARAQANVDNTTAVAESALLRCITDADNAHICAQEALTETTDCQRKLTELESITARSGFGKFLQQEFGAHESIYLSQAPAEESADYLSSSELLVEVPTTSDLKPEVKVSDARVEVELEDNGAHSIEMEIVSPRAEMLQQQKQALEAEAAHLAEVQAEEARQLAEREARRQACREALSWVKKTPTQQSTAPADVHAEELQASVEAIAVEVEETLFSAEEALRSAEEAHLVVMHELGLMNEFHTTADEMSADSVEALRCAEVELQRAQQTSAASAQRVQLADDAFDAHRSTLEKNLKSLSATVVGMARHWEANGTSEKDKAAQRVQFAHQKAALVVSLATEAATRTNLANEHISVVREATHTEESKLLVSSAARLSQKAKEMGAYYTLETLDDAYFCVKSAVEKVQRLQNLIIDHVDSAEGSILSIQAMCMISPARMSRGSSFHSTSMQSLTAELENESNDNDAVHQHNAEELSRVLMLSKDRIQVASTRATALLQDTTAAYEQANDAHGKGQCAVSETVGAAASAMSNATESISVQTSTISSVEVALMLIQHTSRDIDALIAKTQNNVRKCEALAEIAAVEEAEAQERAHLLQQQHQRQQGDSAVQENDCADVSNEQSERDSIDLTHEIAQIPVISGSPTAKKNRRDEQGRIALELDASVKSAIAALNSDDTTETAALTASPTDCSSAVEATPRKRSLFGFSRSFSVFGTGTSANAPQAPESKLKRTTSAMMSTKL